MGAWASGDRVLVHSPWAPHSGTLHLIPFPCPSVPHVQGYDKQSYPFEHVNPMPSCALPCVPYPVCLSLFAVPPCVQGYDKQSYPFEQVSGPVPVEINVALHK